MDDQIEEFFNLQPQERGGDSDVELYASEEDDGDESGDEETLPNNSNDEPPNAVQWSNNLSAVNVNDFSISS